MSTEKPSIDSMVESLLQQTKELDGSSKTAIDTLAQNMGPVTMWTPDLAITLSIIILVFGIAVFVFMGYMINKGHEVNSILRVSALPLIIISATFLIVVGYSQEQIAPVMGLLGTVAGYLLGSANEGSKNDS